MQTRLSLSSAVDCVANPDESFVYVEESHQDANESLIQHVMNKISSKPGMCLDDVELPPWP